MKFLQEENQYAFWVTARMRSGASFVPEKGRENGKRRGRTLFEEGRGGGG